MVSINDAFPSKYIKASDLQGRDCPVTISHVTMETLGSGTDQEIKPVAYFMNKTKGMVLNKTNANTIASVLNQDDTDMWVNGEIVLFPTQVDYGSKTSMAIRVRLTNIPASRGETFVPTATPAAPPIQPLTGNVPAQVPADLDDEIPF